VFLAMCVGAWIEYRTSWRERPMPYSADLLTGMAIGAGAIVIAASVAWIIWCGLVKVSCPSAPPMQCSPGSVRCRKSRPNGRYRARPRADRVRAVHPRR